MRMFQEEKYQGTFEDMSEKEPLKEKRKKECKSLWGKGTIKSGATARRWHCWQLPSPGTPGAQGKSAQQKRKSSSFILPGDISLLALKSLH